MHALCQVAALADTEWGKNRAKLKLPNSGEVLTGGQDVRGGGCKTACDYEGGAALHGLGEKELT
jgi:acyl-coenzyme A thioesterase PaaI-like protein